ncbi:MAG: DUF421 domain-containing protein [Bacilli bacterium]|nr:DUF421 domain-containing protein [Bacilli bacterium]
MDYVIVLSRTVIFYLVITAIYRFMGKREIGQLGMVDLIVSILIAELAAMAIENRSESIFLSLFPIVLLVIIQVGMSYISLKNSKIRNLFDGNPSVIINRGKINFREMVKQRYNIDDLLTQLREKHIRSIEEVDYAVLETSGKLSVFDKDSKLYGEYPMPLILDGEIDYDTLRQINKTDKWLYNCLDDEGVDLKEVFYAFYRNKKLFLIRDKDLRK